MSENENEKMPTRGIRMPDELWKTCIEMSKELGDVVCGRLSRFIPLFFKKLYLVEQPSFLWLQRS